jgi:hypothetical protein
MKKSPAAWWPAGSNLAEEAVYYCFSVICSKTSAATAGPSVLQQQMQEVFTAAPF